EVEELRAISVDTFYEAFIWGNTEENMQYYIRENFSTEKLSDELSDPHSVFYFARYNGKAVGYLKINTGNAQKETLDGRGLEIERIYVLSELRGKNIGQLLFNKAVEKAKEDKLDYVWLGVWEKNPGAIRFYERNGMTVFSTHRFVLGTDVQTDILMKMPLTR
ncbi:MAG: GNAT family N-acetyltransferase, partial [Bacteroidetes bacterium]|nr:GNAT family N-acetyltransferase [Bacteroidota bacterium]